MPRAYRFSAALALLTSLSVLFACAGIDGPAASSSKGALTAVFQCGDQRAAVEFIQQSMRLTLPTQRIEMRQAPAASGARYEAVDDPTTWFWNVGRRATLVVKGRTYPECLQVDEAATDFRAMGNEPGWRVDIEGDRMTLITQDGAKRVVPRPAAAQRTDAFTRYAARTAGEMTVTVFNRRCQDTMTGMPYPHAVEVLYDGRKLSGCGGDPATLLQGPEWTVVDIAGKKIVDRSRATLDFGADGRVSGAASCNRFTAPYTLTGESLTISPRAAVTMMACEPALMQQEGLFLDVLRNVSRFNIGPDGALTLHANDGRTITARR